MKWILFFFYLMIVSAICSCNALNSFSNNNINPCDCEDDKSEKNCKSTYNPVCGCDSITYDNACMARKKGLKKWTKGQCK